MGSFVRAHCSKPPIFVQKFKIAKSLKIYSNFGAKFQKIGKIKVLPKIEFLGQKSDFWNSVLE